MNHLRAQWRAAATAARQPRKWWHLTDTRDFEINPEFSSAGWIEQTNIPGLHKPGLWVTPNPALWYWLWGGRSVAVEIKMPPDIASRAASRMMAGGARPRDQYHLSGEELAQCAVGEIVSVQRAMGEAKQDGYGFAMVGSDPDTYEYHLAPESAMFKVVTNRGYPEKAVCGAKLYPAEDAFEWTTLAGAEHLIECPKCKAALR